MFVRMYVCTYVHTYICTYVSTYSCIMHIRICTYIYICICVHVCKPHLVDQLIIITMVQSLLHNLTKAPSHLVPFGSYIIEATLYVK